MVLSLFWAKNHECKCTIFKQKNLIIDAKNAISVAKLASLILQKTSRIF